MDAAELEVVDILLQLPDLIRQSESRRRLPFGWGAKKRRSCSVDTLTAPSAELTLITPPHPPPPVAPESSAAVGHSCVAEKPKKALSPATPLSFLVSESDDKPKSSKAKVSLKRKRDELLQKIDELSQCGDYFKEEIKNVRHYYDQLKAINAEFKAKKQTLGQGVEAEKPQTQKLNCTTTGTEINRSHQNEDTVHHHQPPLIMDQTAYNSQSSHLRQGQTALGPSNRKSGFVMVNDNVGLVGVIDLNVAPDEEPSFGTMMMIEQSMQPFNLKPAVSDRIALAAQARRRRIDICRSKNPSFFNRLRFPL